MMKTGQEIQARMDKLQNELLYILAKTVVVVPAFLSVLWWVIENANTLMVLLVGVLVLVALLFLLVHWGRTYLKRRKAFYDLEKNFKQHLGANANHRKGDTPMIVFRRH